MALAETARLIASLELQDKLSRGVGSATAGLTTLDKRVGGVQGRLSGFATTLNSKVGGALGTFKSRLSGFANAGLGILGVGGIVGLGAAFKSVVENAREFGDTAIQLSRVTGLTIDSASRLVDVLDFYNIEADKAIRLTGMYTKNVGNLAKEAEGADKAIADYNKTHEKDLTVHQELAKRYPDAIKFQKQYGLQILDSSGKANDFNEQLLESADFFNNEAIPAQQKAAALSKLYGRSWQDLIPILALGREGIKKANKEAISLSEADLKAIKENKQATREWNDAIGDLQVKIGIGLLPTITELTKSFTGWVGTHGDEIKAFAQNALNAAKGIGTTVVNVVSGIKTVWDSIPGPVRDLLLTGLVADRTVKFLFGFSITDVATSIFKGAASGLGSALAQAGIGKAFVQPVFVTNQIAGVPGGVPAAPGAVPVAAKTGLSMLSKVFLVGEAIGLAVLVKEVADNVTEAAHTQAVEVGKTLTESLKNPQTPADLQQKLAGIDSGIAQIKAMGNIPEALFHDTLAELERQRAEVVGAIYHTSSIESRDGDQAADTIVAAIKKDERETAKEQRTAAKTLGKGIADLSDDLIKSIKKHNKSTDESPDKTARKQRPDFNNVKTSVSATKIALISAEQNSKAAITTAQRSAADRIVEAVRAAVTTVSVVVNVSGTGTSVYQTAGGIQHRQPKVDPGSQP